MRYDYGAQSVPDGMDDEQNAQSMETGPKPYNPATPQTTQPVSRVAPADTGPSDGTPMAVPTFAQLQANGEARPPAPMAPPGPAQLAPQSAPAPYNPARVTTLLQDQQQMKNGGSLGDPGYRGLVWDDIQGAYVNPSSGVAWNGNDPNANPTTAAWDAYSPNAGLTEIQKAQQAAAQGAPVAAAYSGDPKNPLDPAKEAALAAQGQGVLAGTQAAQQAALASTNAATNSPAGLQPPTDVGGAVAPRPGLVPGGPLINPIPTSPATLPPAPTPYTPGGAPPAGGGGPGGGVSEQPPGFDILNTLVNGAQGNGAGSAVQNATQAKALDLLNNPSAYGSKDVKDFYDSQAAGIDDSYNQDKSALAESMARRGLGTSTIYSDKSLNLLGNKRTAKEALSTDLAHQYATSLDSARQGAVAAGNTVGTTAQNNNINWLDNLIGYGQQGFNNDLATNAANQNSANSYQNFILQLLGYGQGAGA